MGYETFFAKEPSARDWMQVDEFGRPIYYSQDRTFRYAACRNNPGYLAVALYREQRLAEVERLLPEVTASLARTVGADHPRTLLAKELLTSVYIQINRPGEARRILEEVYETRRRVLGPEHMDTLASQLGLGNVARLERRFADAEKLYRDTLARQERALGENHADTLATRASLATLLSDVGRLGESERLWHDTLARMQRTVGTDHPDTANCLAVLAVIAVIEMQRGRKEAAMQLLRQAVRVNPPWGPKLAADPAFSSLKSNAEFQRLAASAHH